MTIPCRPSRTCRREPLFANLEKSQFIESLLLVWLLDRDDLRLSRVQLSLNLFQTSVVSPELDGSFSALACELRGAPITTPNDARWDAQRFVLTNFASALSPKIARRSFSSGETLQSRPSE